MTCAGCGLELTDNTMPTERGEMHRLCAQVARSQARWPDPVHCFKHGVELDDTGWCPECRLIVVVR